MKRVLAETKNFGLWILKNLYWLKWVAAAGIAALTGGKIANWAVMKVRDKRDGKDKKMYAMGVAKHNAEIKEASDQAQKDLAAVKEIDKQIVTNRMVAKNKTGSEIQDALNNLGL